MFQSATSSATSGSLEERLIVVGQVMSAMPSSVRSKLTKKLSELAEARQNAVSKKAGFKGLDSIVVGNKASNKAESGMRARVRLDLSCCCWDDWSCVCVCVIAKKDERGSALSPWGNDATDGDADDNAHVVVRPLELSCALCSQNTL